MSNDKEVDSFFLPVYHKMDFMKNLKTQNNIWLKK